MLFYLDVDNKERFKITNTILDVDVKELAKSVRHGEKGVHLDIKQLGILVIDTILIDFKLKSVIFKTRLLLDYREHNDDFENYDLIVMEDEFWTSQMI